MGQVSPNLAAHGAGATRGYASTADATGGASVNRLSMAFALMVTLFLIMTGVGLWTLTDISKLVGNVVDGGAKEERLMREWLGETRTNAVRAVVLTRTNDAELSVLLTPALTAATKRISELQKNVEASLSSAEGKALFATVGERRQQYLAARAVRPRDIRQRGSGHFVPIRHHPVLDCGGHHPASAEITENCRSHFPR